MTQTRWGDTEPTGRASESEGPGHVRGHLGSWLGRLGALEIAVLPVWSADFMQSLSKPQVPVCAETDRLLLRLM